MKLMDAQIILPGVMQKTWLHTDGAGNDNITVQSVQDVTPIIKDVERSSQNLSKDMPLLARIPAVVVEETARNCAKIWGLSVKDAFSEMMSNKTDRSKSTWAILVKGRDYRQLQTNHYT